MARRRVLPAIVLLVVLLWSAGSDAADSASAVAPELDVVRVAIRRKDFTAALQELNRLASTGNALAQYRLGAMLLANPQADPDPVQASVWLRKSAAAGEARAAYLLSVIATTQAAPDLQVARDWLVQAGAGGVAQARQLLDAGRLPHQFLPAIDIEESAARIAALLGAARRDDVTTLARLVGDAPANAQDAFGRQPLAIASLADASGSVAWLLQHGATLEARDRDQATALILAAQAPRGSAVPQLIAAHADVDAQDARGNTVLHYSSRSGDVMRVQQLLAAGARVDVLNADGDGPLDLGSRVGSEPVVAALRAAGARSSRPEEARNAPLVDVRRVSQDAYAGQSDLEVAAIRHDPQLLSALLKAGVVAAERDAALLAATNAGSLASARVLLEAGANVAARDALGRSAIHIAVEQDARQMLDLLGRHGARLETPDGGGIVPLVKAVSGGRSGAIDFLLAAGVSTNVADAAGRNVLCIAASRGDGVTLDKLLARTASPRRNAILDALTCAAQRGDAALAKRLLEAAAELGNKDGPGRPALVAAAVSGSEETLRLLLAAGGQADSAGDDGVTILMRAVMSDHLAAAKYLLAAGANVNARDRDGETALTLAARDASADMVRALLAAGAEASYRNANRANAEDIARNLHREAVAQLLSGR